MYYIYFSHHALTWHSSDLNLNTLLQLWIISLSFVYSYSTSIDFSIDLFV